MSVKLPEHRLDLDANHQAAEYGKYLAQKERSVHVNWLRLSEILNQARKGKPVAAVTISYVEESLRMHGYLDAAGLVATDLVGALAMLGTDKGWAGQQEASLMVLRNSKFGA
jgi:hypothetical protein